MPFIEVVSALGVVAAEREIIVNTESAFTGNKIKSTFPGSLILPTSRNDVSRNFDAAFRTIGLKFNATFTKILGTYIYLNVASDTPSVAVGTSEAAAAIQGLCGVDITTVSTGTQNELLTYNVTDKVLKLVFDKLITNMTTPIAGDTAINSFIRYAQTLGKIAKRLFVDLSPASDIVVRDDVHAIGKAKSSLQNARNTPICEQNSGYDFATLTGFPTIAADSNKDTPLSYFDHKSTVTDIFKNAPLFLRHLGNPGTTPPLEITGTGTSETLRFNYKAIDPDTFAIYAIGSGAIPDNFTDFDYGGHTASSGVLTAYTTSWIGVPYEATVSALAKDAFLGTVALLTGVYSSVVASGSVVTAVTAFGITSVTLAAGVAASPILAALNDSIQGGFNIVDPYVLLQHSLIRLLGDHGYFNANPFLYANLT